MSDVTAAAQHGWDEPETKNPHHLTSAEGLGFAAGRSMKTAGHPRPEAATTGRGYQVNLVAGQRFQATFDRTMACGVRVVR